MALKNSKSPGPDKIPTKLLKDAIETICQPLAIAFNASLEKGTFPDNWKVARVTPVFKSGQKSNLSSYRLISVLSVCSRLLEKLAHDQLYDFLRASELLSKNQFVFRKLHSTITSILNTTESWYKNIYERKLNMSIFLDLKKLLTQSTMIFCYRSYQHLVYMGKHIAGSKHTYKIESNSAMLRAKNHLRIKSIVAFLRDRAWDSYYSLYT